MKKRMFALVLAVCTLWVCCCGMSSTKGSLKDVLRVGDIVTFGSYEQDNNFSNGAEPIEWIVLDVQPTKVLVISRHVLDAVRFHNCWAEITWDACDLNAWLNDTFLNTAFSRMQQMLICDTYVSADCNPYFSRLDPGCSTESKLFLLSVPEVQTYLPKSNMVMAAATDYARAQGAFISKSYTIDGRGCAWWWLRSPGGYNGVGYKSYAAIIDGSGAVSGHEVYNVSADYSIGGVRPAMWVGLS